ncbi:alginate lyase [Verrucomicrobia bacterium LW23]|nr:alginate lyase [Verrucomicrobia bacterium LW23]
MMAIVAASPLLSLFPMHLFTTRDAWNVFRQKIAANPGAAAELRAIAEPLLGQPAVTILDRPPGRQSPSPDPHDYFSVGPYWWPDPAKPDGLPYIRRDGEVNPEFHETDRPRMETMVQTVIALAAQAFASPEPVAAQRFGAKAAQQVRAWFLNPQTQMNPHLEYAQGIPGLCKGRGIGIIDTTMLVFMLDAISYLPDNAWTPEDRTGLQKWVDRYLHWLQTSENGIAESKEHNNHGTWYDAQVIAFALYAGKKDVAKATIKNSAIRRIHDQIRKDGSQPHELARTLGLSYSTYNLLGFICIVEMARHVDIDVWHDDDMTSEKLGAAMQFLIPYFKKPETWPYKQIHEYKGNTAILLLSMASQRANSWVVPEIQALKPKPWNGMTYLSGNVRTNEGALPKAAARA